MDKANVLLKCKKHLQHLPWLEKKREKKHTNIFSSAASASSWEIGAAE